MLRGSRRDHAGKAVETTIALADKARDRRQYYAAAVLYEDVLRHTPSDAAIHIQCGHMFKEAGNLESAEPHYMEARRLTPEDPDLALQLGHFYKVAGRLDRSEAAYNHALTLKPGWIEPVKELATLLQRHQTVEELSAELLVFDDWEAARELAPELFPSKTSMPILRYSDGFHIKRLGCRRERSRWGIQNTLRGIEAIRGFYISRVPASKLLITLNGELIHTETLIEQPVPNGENGEQRKYVFNAWFDFSCFSEGLYKIELSAGELTQDVSFHSEFVVIAAPLSETDYPDSDGIINLPEAGSGTLEQRINARASVIRPARRSLFPNPIRNVLVQRTDQLGDIITSIPAIRRLRELLPQAHIVGLLTSANAEFAQTLPLFDEIIIAEFPDDEAERRRIMSAETQELLRRRLEPYRFDLAIDLAESRVSRPLLLLSGARFLYGFYDRDWPWLTGGFEGSSHDRRNYLEAAAQSTKVLALIERIGTAIHSRAEVIKRLDLNKQVLSPYGVFETDRFAVLHTGARIKFSQWPYYLELAEMIIKGTNLKVFLMTDEPSLRQRLPFSLADDARFRLLDQRLLFDEFDAFLSFCAIFVGNDSGPKHLASLRGSNVISIHSSRINWNEWGQEIMGSIISRKVPCAGCAIFHDEDECGKDFACIKKITPAEVFDEVRKLL